MRIALDTNFLAYAEGVNDAKRRARALDIIARSPREGVFIPVQVLGELFNVLVRKAGRSRVEARDAILGWRDAFATVETSTATMLAAADLSADRGFGIWDAVIVAAAAQAGCRLLLSEDMNDGFTWSGVTVVNPFSSESNVLLRAFLDGVD